MKFKGLPAVALAIWAVLSVAVLGQLLYDNSRDPEIEENFPAIFKYMRQASWRSRIDDSG